MKKKMTFIGLLAGACALAGASAANAQTPASAEATAPAPDVPAAPSAGDNAPTVSGPTTTPSRNMPEVNPTLPDPSPEPTPRVVPKKNPGQTPLVGLSPGANGAAAADKIQNPQGAVGVTKPLGQTSAADRQLSRKERDALTQAFPTNPGENGAAATGGIGGLRVTSRNGKVTLRGTVGTQQEKDEAAAKAAAIAGGESNVDNELIVK